MGVAWKPSFETFRAITAPISLSVSMNRTITRARKGGKVTDPLVQQSLFRAAFFDSLATTVFGPIRRLIQQKGLFGMLSVHQFDQRFSESFDARKSRVFLGKMDARPGSHAVGIVTLITARFL